MLPKHLLHIRDAFVERFVRHARELEFLGKRLDELPEASIHEDANPQIGSASDIAAANLRHGIGNPPVAQTPDSGH